MKIKNPPYAVENITIGKNPDVQIWCQYLVEPPNLFIPENFKSTSPKNYINKHYFRL